MKRRDYLIVSGLTGITGYKLHEVTKNSAYANINQFIVSGNDSLDQTKTDKLQFNFSRLEIETNRIDASKPAEIVFEVKYQDDEQYVELDTYNIYLNESGIKDYSDNIEPVRLFSEERLSDEQLQENDFDDFQIRVNINHPNIQKISQTSTFRLGLVDLGGELKETSFGEGYMTRELKPDENEHQKDDMSTWDEDDFTILTQIVSSTQFTNKSSYILPNGVIDWNVTQFDLSPRNNGEKNLQDISNSHTTNDMSTWSEDDFTVLTQIVSSKQFTNESSYTLPKGIIDWNVTKFDLSPRNKGERNLQDVSNSHTTNDMSTWSEDDFTILTQIVSSKQFTNNSSYILPKGIIDWNVTKFDLSPRNKGERKLNIVPVQYN